MLHHNGFTLVEVVVAGLIFAIAVSGVFASIASVQNQSNTGSEESLGAALCGQEFLEGLRAKVDNRDWDSSQLALTPLVATTACTQNGTAYTRQYKVEAVPGSLARKVTVIVTWP
jgi:Tfp pilus assembly protein PilV